MKRKWDCRGGLKVVKGRLKWLNVVWIIELIKLTLLN